ALKQLQSPPYPIEQQEADCEYVAKKLGFSQQEFAAMMRASPRKFSDFPSYSSFVSSEGFQRIVRLRQLLFRRQSAPPMLNSRPTAAAPTVGLYFISGARKSYNIAKTLSLAGCKVLVRVEPSQVELTDRNHPNHVDRHYCALLYSDEKIELIADASKAPPVDALLHELCLTPSRHSTELRAWTRQTARAAAWHSSWHEMSAWANLRSELSIVSKFFEFLPRTRTVVMHNGRRIFRPTALFSRSFRQGAFVHPLFLFDPELRAEMF